MEGAITLIILALLAFIGFAIYFFFKILQFVLQATNLYKDMVTRQDTMIKILKDIHESSQHQVVEKDNTDDSSRHKGSKKTAKKLQTEMQLSEVKNILNEHFSDFNNVIETPYSKYYLVKHDDFKFTMVYIDDNKSPSIIDDDEVKSMPKLYAWYQDYFD